MKISYQWLQEFVEIPVDARSLADALSMAGLPTESIEERGEDSILELEVTSNRGDCLSHWGIAREVATIFHLPLKPPKISIQEASTEVGKVASVDITAPDLCHRYCARVVVAVKVGPSPSWLVDRLEALGQRSINNVADITNLVLLELGHPLHAFDLDKLEKHQIIVRRAKRGEHLVTLDGVERALSTDHLVIADAVIPVALAGVMGGAHSEISASTRNVLIESAWFLPTSIRQTARTLGMHTEASHRFERGTDIENVITAMNRCAQLIQEIAGGEIQRGIIDCHPTPVTPVEILLRPAQVKRHLGVDVEPQQVDLILKSLQFKKINTTGAGTLWRTPTWRNDVTREIDLIEEAARHYGYDKFPSRMPKTSTRGSNLAFSKPLSQLKERLRALGYFETVTFPFLDPIEAAQYSDLLPVELANPLSDVAGALRTSMVPTFLQSLAHNIHYGQRDLRLFETGKIYYRDAANKPVEREELVFGFTKSDRLKDSRERILQREVEAVLSIFNVHSVQFNLNTNSFLKYWESPPSEILVAAKSVGIYGKTSSDCLDRYKIKQDVYLAEVHLEELLKIGQRKITFKPFSSFPYVQRDISFIVPIEFSWPSIRQTLHIVDANNLIRIKQLGDPYGNASFGQGKQSWAVRLTFQSADRTLVEEEVNTEVEKVMAALETQLHAKIRKEK